VAATSSRATSDLITKGMTKWLRETPTSFPFTDLYETGNGNYGKRDDGAVITFRARPVMGAVFAPLLARYNA
jgi:hypothetical protein